MDAKVEMRNAEFGMVRTPRQFLTANGHEWTRRFPSKTNDSKAIFTTDYTDGHGGGDGGQKPEFRGQRSEVRGQRSEARSQKSEVRSQKSEVRGQRSDFRGQRSE